MAVNIFDKYGIKQVANVYFEALENDIPAGVYKGDIVLFLDTLKVSTIETSAENVAAQGGWGNPRLISWDYGKEINVTLTDALMSLESLRFMMGGAIKNTEDGTSKVVVRRTAEVVCETGGALPAVIKDRWGEIVGDITPSEKNPIQVINLTKGYRTQITSGGKLAGGKTITFNNDAAGVSNQVPSAGDRLRIFWKEERTDESSLGAVEVTISPSTFPGTYRVVGDTFMRSQKSGKDEPFQFVIEKAKVQSNVTLTLEAEGDPTTFEMTLQVLRDEAGDEMMKLIRYDTEDTGENTSGDDYGSISADG